jgi:hypothetical protein
MCPNGAETINCCSDEVMQQFAFLDGAGLELSSETGWLFLVDPA